MYSPSDQDTDSTLVAGFVQSSTRDALHDAICKYLLSDDPGVSIKALEIIEETTRQDHEWHQEYLETAISVLKENKKNSLAVFLEYACKQPFSQLGKDCAYILGQVAYYQRTQPDPRILPTLLEIAEKTLLVGIEESRTVLTAICECSWYRRIPEANKILGQTLDLCIRHPNQIDGFSFFVGRILETLLTSNGDDFLEELDVLVNNLDRENEMSWEIRYFLAQARMEQIVEGAPSSLDSMIADYSRVIQTTSESRELFFLGGILHEIASIQGENRDPRIPILALRALEARLSSVGIDCELYSELGTIERYVQQKSIPEADKTVLLVLKELKTRENVDKKNVLRALDILYANNGLSLEDLYGEELRDLMSEFGNQSVSEAIKEYLCSTRKEIN